MSDEMKPCPFCGGKAECDRTLERYEYLIEGDRSCMDYGYTVYCTQCGLETHVRDTPPNDPDEAIDDWNTRPIEDALRQRIAELETQLAAYDAMNTALVETCAGLEAQLAQTWQPVGDSCQLEYGDLLIEALNKGRASLLVIMDGSIETMPLPPNVRLCERGGA